MKKCQRYQNNFCMSLKINYIFESCSKKTVFCSRKIVKIVHEIEVKHKDEIYFFLSPRNVLYALLIWGDRSMKNTFSISFFLLVNMTDLKGWIGILYVYTTEYSEKIISYIHYILVREFSDLPLIMWK